MIVSGARKGGVINIHTRSAYIPYFDSFDATGRAGVAPTSPALNNILWTDPYGDGNTLTGDAARDWVYSGDGRTLTLTLHRGIKFHDGNPLTSRDVAYNVDRGRKPRSPRMTQFAGKLDVIESVDTPDELTVRVNLNRPSNFILQALSIVEFLVYPAHMPMPEQNDQWSKTRIGSGPFKLKQVGSENIEYVRNDAYWKQGLPHVDGLVFHGINDTALLISALRSGRIDAVTYGNTFELEPSITDGTLQRAQGFNPHRVTVNGSTLRLAQKEPWTNPKVREAVDLAINRQDLVKLGYNGGGLPAASPLLPPDLGGKWGIPVGVSQARPGVRPNKTEDIARAKALLREAGVDPGKVTTRILAAPTLQSGAQVIEANLRDIGFSPQLVLVEPAQTLQALQSGTWEIIHEGMIISLDDPSDYLGAVVLPQGLGNRGKWSDPEVESLFAEQDRTLDQGKRKEILNRLQARVLDNRHALFLFWGWAHIGANRVVKNYPPKPLFLFSPVFRWEQVWLDRSA